LSGDVSEPTSLISGLSEADAELLQTLLRSYDEFADRNDQSRSWNFDTARVHFRIGEIHHRLGNNTEALRTWQRCLDVLANEPAEGLPTALLAVRTENAIGRVHMASGRFNQASLAFRDALSRLDALDEQTREDSAARLSRAVTLTQIINAWSAEHHYEQTRRGPRRRGADHTPPPPESVLHDFAQSSSILSRLAEEEPNNREIQLALSRCYSSILPYAWEIEDAVLATDSKQQAVTILRRLHTASPDTENLTFQLADTLALTPEAVDEPLSDQDIADLTESSGLASNLHERFPTSVQHHLLLASVRLKRGTHHSLAQNTKQAEQSLMAAVTDWRSLCDQAPTNALLHVAHARTCWTLADLHRRQNRPTEAIEQLEAAVSDLESFINENGRAGISNGLLVGLYRRMAFLHQQSGNEELAVEAIRSAEMKRKN